jgi:hypothetical protein
MPDISDDIQKKICEEYSNTNIRIKELCIKYKIRPNTGSNNLYALLSKYKISLRTSKKQIENSISDVDFTKIPHIKEILIPISPIISEMLIEYCEKTGISQEMFIKKHLSNYLITLCEALNIL